MQWKPFPTYVVAIVAIVAGIVMQRKHDVQMAVAVNAVKQANRDAEGAEYATAIALQIAQKQVAVRQAETARADAAEAEAKRLRAARAALQPAVQRVIAAAPDTCKPVIEALTHTLATADSTADALQTAFDAQKRATAALQVAYDTTRSALLNLREKTVAVRQASTQLTRAAKGSFLSHFVPTPGIGCAAGVNPQGRPDAVCGVTLSWRP